MNRGRIVAAFLVAFALFAFFAPSAHAQNFPACSGYVMDTAGALNSGTVGQLDTFLGALDKKTTAQIAVAVVDTLDGISVEEYAQKFYKKCGFGQKGKDNGILFLVALQDHKMRIEVGYGLEGAMNDAKAGHLLDTEVVPRFKANDVNGGIMAGTVAIAAVVAKEYNLTLADIGSVPSATEAPADTSSPEPNQVTGREAMSDAFAIFMALPLIGKIIVLLIIAFAIFLIATNPGCFFGLLFSLLGGGGSSGGGGGFGGGFGGFGGGMSGGGGSSRGW